MSRKRKIETTVLDELDRTMFSTFSASANSLYQLYALAQSQQKLAFQAGEHHGLEKLHRWILGRQGVRLIEADVVAYIENELGYSKGDASMVLTSQSQQPLTDAQMHIPPPIIPMPHGADPVNYTIYSAALSTPLCGNLQPFNITPGVNYCVSAPQESQSGMVGMNTGDFMAQSYTHLPQKQDTIMDVHAEDSHQPFFQ